MSKNEFWTKSTGEDYKQMWNEYDDFVLHIVEIASVEKIFKNLDFAKASRIDQISFNLLKEGTLSSCDIRDLYCCECSHQKIVLDYFTTKSENFFATSKCEMSAVVFYLYDRSWRITVVFMFCFWWQHYRWWT